MENMQKINENIHRLTIPYKDIYTTVFTVITDSGVMLFDTASYDEDIESYILPFLNELGFSKDMVKYVCISHNHTDHAGGLKEFMKSFPQTTIISRCPILKEQYVDYSVLSPENDDIVLDVLKIVTIPGHTKDCIGVYDMRTKTLLSGDSLQLFGIYGSGDWACNIPHPQEHIEAIDKLKKMEINQIITAHDYHPFGYSYVGNDAISDALEACITPLYNIQKLILQNPEADDRQICNLYNSLGLPTLAEHVASAIRDEL